jgi:hypothetical protein
MKFDVYERVRDLFHGRDKVGGVREGFAQVLDRCFSLRVHVLSSAARPASTPYSITWSARTRIDCGMVNPSAFAVFMLITSSNFVGCSMGRSAGLAPLRILST